jgi:hypothetical protein
MTPSGIREKIIVERTAWIRKMIEGVQALPGCCPNKNSFERSLKRFLRINLGAAEDQRFELFEPEGRVFKSPGASLRFIKKRFRPSEKGFGQQPVTS